MITALLIDPGKAPVPYPLPSDSIGALQELCAGVLSAKPFGLDRAALLYVDNPNLPPNRKYKGAWYHGRLLIVGATGAAFKSLTKEQTERYSRIFHREEVQEC